jgi:hypothetical protein
MAPPKNHNSAWIAGSSKEFGSRESIQMSLGSNGTAWTRIRATVIYFEYQSAR